ncbi:MAG: PH domain-containing protein [Clostridia bacterium]|nr:PH domain-containing protein [Clostridia bacterium]
MFVFLRSRIVNPTITFSIKSNSSLFNRKRTCVQFYRVIAISVSATRLFNFNGKIVVHS